MTSALSPLEQERAELGYNIEDVRGKALRVIAINSEPSSSRCVFFFHGGGGRACQFKNQIRSLKNKLDVVAVDFLGHGDSKAPNQPELYTEEEHFQDTYELFMKYRKSENYIVAHCYGVIHTMRLLKRLRSEDLHGTVKGCVFISIGINCPVSSSGGSLTKLPAFFLEWLRPLARSASNAKLFSPQTSPELIAFENQIADNNRMYMMRVIGADCANIGKWNGWLQEGKEGIGEDINVAFIIGEQDGFFPVESIQELRLQLGVSEEQLHVISDAAHLPMLEKPDIVCGIIEKFIGFD